MKPFVKKLSVGLGAILSLFIVCWLAWPMLPVAFRVRVVRAVYSVTNDRYLAYNRLGAMLKFGMSPDDVRAILGTPDIEQSVAGGRRWSYEEVGPTAGGTSVVDFAPDGDTFRLCYFVNVQHIVFRDSPHREFGSPVDGGRFEHDLLKLRWDEWHTGERSNKALQATATAPSALTNR